jgi:hypothetical protein
VSKGQVPDEVLRATTPRFVGMSETEADLDAERASAPA